MSIDHLRRLRIALQLPLLGFALGLCAPIEAAMAAGLSGSGRMISESRSTGEFQAVSAHGSIDVVVRQGAETQVQVHADDNLLPLLETVVEDGTLWVRWKRGERVSTRSKVRVEVVTPRLTSFAGTGSGDLRLESFKTPRLNVALSGSGDAGLTALSTDYLRVSTAGSGDIKAEGRAMRVDIAISGSGNVQMFDLIADEVSVRIAGSGDAAVQAQRKLAVSIAGSGDVAYRGDAEVTSAVAGSGRVKKR